MEPQLTLSVNLKPLFNVWNVFSREMIKENFYVHFLRVILDGGWLQLFLNVPVLEK
jgi:hypothetical protein